jgi:hypothetical protein
MSNPKSAHSARSRAPIDEIGLKWWEQYGDNQPGQSSEFYEQNEIDIEHNQEQKNIADKSTSTNTLETQRMLTSQVYKDYIDYTTEPNNPKDIVLKKWREDQAKAKYEQARKAVINSLKEKFGAAPKHANIHPIAVTNKTHIRKIIPPIIITGDNVEEISNLNAQDERQTISNLEGGGFRVEVGDRNDEGVCHASRLQMGPGCELAQWRLAPGGSKAAGAEGGIRGLAREDMPVSTL